MWEVLKNSAAICITASGFNCQQVKKYSCQSKFSVGCSHCKLGGGPLKWKQSGKISVLCDLNNESFVGECGSSWCGSRPKKMTGVKWSFGSVIRCPNLIMNAGFERELAQEEEEVSISIPKTDAKLNVSIHGEKDTVSGEENGAENDCSECSFDLVENEAKMHFLEERDEERLSKRMLKLSRSNKVRSALELYISMEASGLCPSVHACNSLLSCLLRVGFLDDALRVFKTMKGKGIGTGHTYSLILKAVAGNHGCDSALRIFVELEEGGMLKNSDAIVYNTMISVCGKAKDWVQIHRLWRRLKQDGYSGTAVTYRLLVSSFVRCGQTELAIEAYHEMIQNKFEPGEDVMKAVIGAYVKEGKWDLALRVLQQMLDRGLKPNAIAYNALISCLGKAGKIDPAFKIYNAMKSSGHAADAYTWYALLIALYRGNRYSDALHLFESIRVKHGSELNDHIYNVALMSCQRLRLWDRSLQLLWQMEASGILVSTESYNHVIEACEAARKPQVALQVYKHMIHVECTPDTFTYLSLIRACIWGSLWTEALEILESVAPNASLFNALIHGMCLRGRSMSAEKLYMRMRRFGLKPDGKTRALMLQHLQKDSVTRHTRFHSQHRH